MIKIETGKGTISLPTLLAIWSISLVVNLPGLAVSPMLGDLGKIFPTTSELEIQLLTVLPNLLIIPFVLLSGKLSVSKSKRTIVVTSLVLYLLSGVLYLFANSMPELILISCLLGIGCGMLIPLAAGLIADNFTGKRRMQQLGIKSGIANISLVMATFAVGFLNGDNWHLPFLVYLIPLIPLLLTPFLKGVSANGGGDEVPIAKADVQVPVEPGTRVVGNILVGRLLGLMSIYFFVTFAVIVISFYLPFLIQDYGIDGSLVGTVTSLFFLAVFLPGFFLPFIIKRLKQNTFFVAALLIAGGLLLMVITRSGYAIGLGAFLTGFGYGIFQPILYDKATAAVTSERVTTLALSFVLAINYLAITVAPFLIDLFRWLMDAQGNRFPFLLNVGLTCLFALFIKLFRKRFAFRMNEQYYQ